MPTVYSTMNILAQSGLYTIANMPESVKNTHRFLLKFLHANYISDVDLTFNLYYKQGYTNLENLLTYVLSKDENFFKMKLPTDMTCREFKFEIVGTAVSSVEISEFGCLATLKRVGAR